MAAGHGRKKKHGEWDLNVDLKPAMDVVTALIPFLLLFASFASIKVMEMDFPETLTAEQSPVKDKDDEGLLLTVFVSDDGITLGAKGAMLPTTYTREFHKYVYSYPVNTNDKLTYLYRVPKENRNELPLCPQDKSRRFTLYEREEIILNVIEKQSESDSGTVMMAVYNKLGQVMTYRNDILTQLPRAGDTLYTLGLTNWMTERVINPADYTLNPLSVYDQLAVRLIRVQAKYPDAPDKGEIKIVAEDDVVFDKLVHVMDVCRDFGFPKIGLAKLAG